MMGSSARVMSGSLALGILAVTLLTFFFFPGHTYLQSDTQIYIPLMERLWDPSLLGRDLMASRPHLAYTLYDEVAFVIRRVTHAPFQYALEAQQIAFRALGLWGVFLAATALGLERRFAFVVMALFGLGATIIGPAVLTFEYEPVPRGFAVMLMFCAIGLAMRGRLELAGIAGAVAFLYHAPTTVPFWIVFGFVSYQAGRRAARAWIPLALAAALILVVARFQPGIAERQVFFGRIDPAMVEIQRIRAPYNWISLWPASVFWHYAVLAAATAAAVRRLRITGAPRAFLLGMTLLGLLSLPFSFVALDLSKWTLMPQFQPARAVLFVTAMSVIACAAAAVRANWMESAAWLLIPIIVPLHKSVLPPLNIREAIVLFGSAAAIACFLAWTKARPRLLPALLATVLAAYFVMPKNYPDLWTQDLISLNAWARESTPKDALFHFPDAGKALYPGIFRAVALRPVYVDWKAGGQVNYFKSLGDEWWKRWRETMVNSPGATDLRSRGIDFVVVKKPSDWQGGTLVYSNGTYTVFRLPSRGLSAPPVAP